MENSLIAPPAAGSDVPVVAAHAVSAAPASGDGASAAATPAAEPRVLLRLGFNKVLYDTDIHPDGYVAPRPGQTVRHEPKVSFARQCGFTCVFVSLVLMIGMRWADLSEAVDGAGPESAMGGRHAWEEEAGQGDTKFVPRDCSASYHATQGGGIEFGGGTIPSSDEEVSSAIGMSTWPGGIDPNGDDEDGEGQLSWANCPAAQDCCEGTETCCTAMRPSCVGEPGDKHCCEMDDVFCPVDEGDAPVGLREPKGARAMRSYPHALPGTSAPECCAGECLRQSYTDKAGAEQTEHYCCTDRSCRGWTQEGEELVSH